jgi:hypothetical protein
MDNSPDISAISGAVATCQPAQQSKLLGNLEFTGRAASSQAAQNKPAQRARE